MREHLVLLNAQLLSSGKEKSSNQFWEVGWHSLGCMQAELGNQCGQVVEP